mmetsp:Transcript_9207/g.16214  ORF Transcript_9207/g.16214 Transcript_9207/m.16214 type:complete len:106 (+) Transcript_9207:225-542(+)
MSREFISLLMASPLVASLGSSRIIDLIAFLAPPSAIETVFTGPRVAGAPVGGSAGPDAGRAGKLTAGLLIVPADLDFPVFSRDLRVVDGNPPDLLQDLHAVACGA